MAEYLWRARSPKGRTIQEVLLYAIWGDEKTANCGERVWTATFDEEWRIPHFGAHTIGELIGYARPDEFPPRNGRVSKTLYALGYSGVGY